MTYRLILTTINHTTGELDPSMEFSSMDDLVEWATGHVNDITSLVVVVLPTAAGVFPHPDDEKVMRPGPLVVAYGDPNAGKSTFKGESDEDRL